jgi:hypothetical protein
MTSFFLIVICFLTTGLAWRRIFSQRYFWLVKVACLIFTLIPIAGPIFYLMIDPPESSPTTINPEGFWLPTKGTQVWPSFGLLIKSLSEIFKR